MKILVAVKRVIDYNVQIRVKEDETGIVNVVVPKAVWQHCGPKNRRAPVLMVKGRIQRRGNVVHLLARRLEAWREDDTNELSLVDLPRMSRDFC